MSEKLFVGIYEPVDVRRNLLEASREVVGSLQSYEKLGVLRANKLRNFEEMRKIMQELDLLVTKLKTKLPKSQLRKALGNVKPQKTRERLLPKNVDMQKLESEIRNIEREFSKIKLS
jgi:hypothetical protein